VVNKWQLHFWIVWLAAITAVWVARADSIVYDIPDLLPLGTFGVPNTGQTYSGTGFVQNTPNNSHQGAFEISSNFSTALNVDISALAGMHVDSAALSFFIDTQPDSVFATATITSFSADGDLGYFLTPPDNLDSFQAPVHGQTNTIDVTDLLAARVDDGADWLGLHLTSDGSRLWTWTSGPGDPNAANVQLAVEFSPAVVPEPSSMVSLGIGLSMLGVHWRFRNKRRRA